MMGKIYCPISGFTVVVSSRNVHIKYIVKSNHNAFAKHATHVLILVLSWSSLTSGCKPKNMMKGITSQNLADAKIKLKKQAFSMSWLFPSGGQSIGALASASVLHN